MKKNNKNISNEFAEDKYGEGLFKLNMKFLNLLLENKDTTEIQKIIKNKIEE
jgi:hypothetical protein